LGAGHAIAGGPLGIVRQARRYGPRPQSWRRRLEGSRHRCPGRRRPRSRLGHLARYVDRIRVVGPTGQPVKRAGPVDWDLTMLAGGGLARPYIDSVDSAGQPVDRLHRQRY
jgi:hypothetical protein